MARVSLERGETLSCLCLLAAQNQGNPLEFLCFWAFVNGQVILLAPIFFIWNCLKWMKTFRVLQSDAEFLQIYRVEQKAFCLCGWVNYFLKCSLSADWLCMGWSVCQAAAKAEKLNRGALFAQACTIQLYMYMTHSCDRGEARSLAFQVFPTPTASALH